MILAKTAILIDGGFYRKMAPKLFGSISGKERANELIDYCFKHLSDSDELYRIFYYDCPPIKKKMFHPLTKEEIDLSLTPICKWYDDFIKEMVKKRKVALREGRLSEENASYVLIPTALKQLCNHEKTIDELTVDDFEISVRQKGVDMKIGVDIASLAYKQQVDRIILIAGDSDFVPASKLARREGIDFILDPLWNHINDDLREHIDGLSTKAPKPGAKPKPPKVTTALKKRKSIK